MKLQRLKIKPPKKERKATEKVKRSRKRRTFDQTRLGFQLKHEAPVEYALLMEAIGESTRPPSAELIEALAYASDEALFQKDEFWLALREYRKTGLYPREPVKTNARKELYYIYMRQNASRN